MSVQGLWFCTDMLEKTFGPVRQYPSRERPPICNLLETTVGILVSRLNGAHTSCIKCQACITFESLGKVAGNDRILPAKFPAISRSAAPGHRTGPRPTSLPSPQRKSVRAPPHCGGRSTATPPTTPPPLLPQAQGISTGPQRPPAATYMAPPGPGPAVIQPVRHRGPTWALRPRLRGARGACMR